MPIRDEFKLIPSKRYTTLLGSFLLINIVILMSMDLSIGLKWVGIGVVLGYGGKLFIRDGLLRGKKAITALTHEASGGSFQLHTQAGVKMGKLRGDSTVTSWASVLRFEVPGEWLPRTCVVFCDSLFKGRYRQLLVKLRQCEVE